MLQSITITPVGVHQLVGVPLTHLSLLIFILRLVQSEHHDSFHPEQEVVYDQEDLVKIVPDKGLQTDKEFRNQFYANEKDEQLPGIVDGSEDSVPAQMIDDVLSEKRFDLFPPFYHGIQDWRHGRMKLINKRDTEKEKDLPTFLETPRILALLNVSHINDTSILYGIVGYVVALPGCVIEQLFYLRPSRRGHMLADGLLNISRFVLQISMFDRLVAQLLRSRRHAPVARKLSVICRNKKVRTLVFVLLFLFIVYLVSHDNHTSNATDMEASKVETTTKPAEEKKPELPPPGAAEEEHHSSLTIFFILLVVAIAILLVHLLIQTKFHYMPDSIAIVLIGAFIGLLLKLFKFGNWKNEEAFPPTIFFIVLLPPIIFEGGYNLHKGNFFQNIGSILVFAVFGTVISAVVVGGGVYFLGQAEVVYKFDFVESFAFGSLVSAVDPVATLAIFQALDADPILYMLVFGESMLNDAVSIVLTSTMLEFASPGAVAASGTTAFFQALGRFCLMFFASSAIGVAFGLLSAMVTKFVDLHKTPSLEVGIVFCFSYLPYALAEGIHLSGIMAILFCGIVMSHYTHLNLSPVSQITVQQTFRTIAFICETCVFAYLGLAIFSFKVFVKPAFTIWSIVLILLGRALNIFPLSFLVNFFREHKITRKNQFIMWFSGLRGAVAFALSLHLEFVEEKHYILVTTTLIMVLFTTVFLGGATMPLLKFLQSTDKKHTKKKRLDGEVSMSKTKEMGDAIDSEHLSEITEDDETHVIRPHMTGFTKIDARYLIPFFTKRFTQQEMREGRSQVDMLATQWQKEVRADPSESEDDTNTEIETCLITTNSPTAAVFQNSTLMPSDNV